MIYLNEEIDKYIKMLEKPFPNMILGNEKSVQQKVKALNKIEEIGKPSVIYWLIPFLKHKSERIHKATVHTVGVVFEQLKGKNKYYQSLRYCSISKEDIIFYKQNYNQEEFILLMKICSLNRDGYVREKAVKHLDAYSGKDVLPFILYRLADWVPQVRKVAYEKLQGFLHQEYSLELVSNLSLFKSLQKVERTNITNIYREFVDFLVIENREYIYKLFSQISDKERCILAKELIKSLRCSNELTYFVQDKSFLIRLLALNHFNRLSDLQKETLCKDKSGRVRHNVLYCFKGTPSFKTLLMSYLADTSGSIRYTARYYLRDEKINFEDFYINNLKNNIQVIGSLLGLVDVESNCSKYVALYLKNKRTRVVKTAFYVLSSMDSEKAYAFAKEYMFTKQIGLRNQIIKFFEQNYRKEIIDMASEKFKEGDVDVKLSILKLFSQIGGYSVVPNLLIATIDDNKVVRLKAKYYIHKWKNEAVNMSTVISQQQKELVFDVFRKVNQVHETKSYFKDNPVEGLWFYLK